MRLKMKAQYTKKPELVKGLVGEWLEKRGEL